jgi:hypothetical protein
VDERRRAAERRAFRRRRAAAVGTGLVVVAAAAWGVTRLGAAGGRDDPAAGGSGRAVASELLALQVTGTEDPLLALVGTARADRAAAFFTVPFDLTMTVPGQGEAGAADVAAQPPDTMRVAVSNAFGVWADGYAVLDLEGLAAVVDRSGGIRMQVPGVYATDAGDLGPGAADLTGEQVAALLSVRDESGEARWASVVQGLFREPLELREGDLVASSGFGGVRRLLGASVGAGLALFPTSAVTDSVLVPQQPQLDRQVANVFGVEAPPVPVIVENGVGTPGLGQDVAALLLPQGFRVVVSQNADPFGLRRTRVIANGEHALADAQRIAEALGVGRVGVSQVPSGIGDITIIVGEDFTG